MSKYISTMITNLCDSENCSVSLNNTNGIFLSTILSSNLEYISKSYNASKYMSTN